MRLAVIGAGAMGSRHARVLSRIAAETGLGVELAYVVDIDVGRAEAVAKTYGGTPVSSISEVRDVDGAVVATPTSTHFEIVSRLIEKNIGFILVEKPMTQSFDEAVKLSEMVEDSGVVLNVGFVERFNPVLTALLGMREKSELGRILNIFSLRIGSFDGRARDMDVTLDLGSHEIDISILLIGKLPVKVRSLGLPKIVSNKIDHGWIFMDFGDSTSIVEVSRLSPVKLRLALVQTSSLLVFMNYLDQELVLSQGDQKRPVSVTRGEPLYLEDLYNIVYFQKYRKALVDAYQGLVVQYIYDLASESSGKGVDVSFTENTVYATYSDVFKKGLDGFKNFWSCLSGLLAQFPVSK